MDGAAPTLSTGQRTLAAILFTDVVGFSALMQKDEEHTLRLLERDFGEMRRICTEHGGVVLKTTGDGLLCTFASAVKAVSCAMAMQRGFGSAASQAAADDVLQHRIGIHLGDVVVQEQDVMGDGVNIAARLQAEAQPGGICISQTVYDVVKNKLAIQTTYIGARELKNIVDAVPVYRILLEAELGAGTPNKPEMPPPRAPSARRWPWWAVGGAAAAVLVAVPTVWRLRSAPAAVPAGAPPKVTAVAPTPAATGPVATATAVVPAAAPAATALPNDLPTDPEKLMAYAYQHYLRQYDFAKFAEFVEREDATRGKQSHAAVLRWARDLADLRQWMIQRLSGYDEERPLRLAAAAVAGEHTPRASVYGISADEIGLIENGAVQHRALHDVPPAQVGELLVTLLRKEDQPSPDMIEGALAFARVFHLPEMRETLTTMGARVRNERQQALQRNKQHAEKSPPRFVKNRMLDR